jgi:hypothetical protein
VHVGSRCRTDACIRGRMVHLHADHRRGVISRIRCTSRRARGGSR